MEKIIQIAVKTGEFIALTSDGRIFITPSPFLNNSWEESSLPPLHTNEIDHKGLYQPPLGSTGDLGEIRREVAGEVTRVQN